MRGGESGESLTESVLREEPNTQPSDSDTGHGEADVVSEFVGEGKKYATNEEALKALAKKAKHADEFIETLKSEKQQVLNELNETKGKVQTAQELLELMRNNESAEEHIDSSSSSGQTPTLTREEILKTMEGILQQRETAAKRKAQFESSMKTLTETFGSEKAARESIANFIKADPSNKVIVDTIGVSNPAKLAKLIKEELGEPETFSPDRTTSVTTRFDNVVAGLTWTKAKELKKKNPAMYNSVKFQRKLQDAVLQNNNFYTT